MRRYRTVGILTGSQFVNNLGFGCVIPVLPLFASDMGLGASGVGLILRYSVLLQPPVYTRAPVHKHPCSCPCTPVHALLPMHCCRIWCVHDHAHHCRHSILTAHCCSHPFLGVASTGTGSTSATARLLLNIPLGRLSDRIGRKPLMIGGQIGTVCFILPLAYSLTHHYHDIIRVHAHVRAHL